MHQILHLDELVRNISRCADSTRKGSASLLAFASCCKSLEGPVMDVLWQRQVDMSTILKTLPAGSWTDTNNIFSLSRNLSRDEWGRFKKYTARVIALGIPSVDTAYFWFNHRAWVSVETIQLIGMEFQRGEFWPRLCSLKCNIDWDVVPFLSSFLNPTITDLSLTLPRKGNRLVQPTLSLLAHTCRQLQSLTVNVSAPDPLSGGEMGLLISASRHTLRHIEIKSLAPPEIFPAILDLPRLQDLIVQGPHIPSQIPPQVLPCLRVINFHGSRGQNLPQFFRGVTVSGLETVTVTHRGTIHASTILDPLRGASATMKMLYLSPVMALDHSSITLLCSFTNLTSLSIGCTCGDPNLDEPCSFQPTDENMLELGGALPHLILLSLAPRCRRPVHVTLTSLICLSKTCANLSSLTIRVDFTSLVGGPDQLDDSSSGRGVNNVRPQWATSRLDTLTVGNSPLPDFPRCEWVVALALVRIFPSIRYLYSHCIEGMRERWEMVRADIPVCQKIFRITQATNATPLPTP